MFLQLSCYKILVVAACIPDLAKSGTLNKQNLKTNNYGSELLVRYFDIVKKRAQPLKRSRTRDDLRFKPACYPGTAKKTVPATRS